MNQGPILSLDLAGALASAAVWADGAIVGAAERRVAPAAGAGHETLWRGLLIESLASAGLSRAALSLLAVTVGPGSFTGIRVAIAVTRGLGLALGLPVWGESAFVVAAESVDSGGRPLLVALDSGRGAFFAQRFDAQGAPEGPAEDGAFADVVESWLVEGGRMATGDEAIRARLTAAGHVALVPALAPASALATRVARLRESGAAVGAPTPLYIRPPDATPPARGGMLRE